MADKSKKVAAEQGFGLPVMAMLFIGIISGIVSAFSFWVIPYWPLPASVAPMLDWQGGLAWGLVIGGVSGLVLGFCTDDNNFADS